MSLKGLLCDLCVILFLCLAGVLADPKSDVQAPKVDGSKGNCTCGAFTTTKPNIASSPVLSQSSGLMVNCDNEGETKCKSLCNAIAIATKAKGPEILCEALNNAEELTLSAFSKVCNMPWLYADFTADTPLCCKNTKVKMCASTAEQNGSKMTATKAV